MKEEHVGCLLIPVGLAVLIVGVTFFGPHFILLMTLGPWAVLLPVLAVATVISWWRYFRRSGR